MMHIHQRRCCWRSKDSLVQVPIYKWMILRLTITQWYLYAYVDMCTYVYVCDIHIDTKCDDQFWYHSHSHKRAHTDIYLHVDTVARGSIFRASTCTHAHTHTHTQTSHTQSIHKHTHTYMYICTKIRLHDGQSC